MDKETKSNVMNRVAPLPRSHSAGRGLRLIIGVVFLILLCWKEAVAQWHIHASEAAGNYSSAFWCMSLRNRLLENGHGVNTPTTHRNSEMVFLPTFLIPLSEEFALGAEVPYYVRSLTEDSESRQKWEGFGDISLLAKYTFTVYEEFHLLSKDHLLKARISLITKIKLPTAAHDAVDSHRAPLPHDLQLGTGSTDISLGFAFLTETEEYFMIHGHLMYRMNTRTKDFKEGNALDYELRYIFARIPLGIFYPSVGLRGTVAAKNSIGSENIQDSGGHLLFLSPGIQTLWSYLDFAGMFFMVEVSGQFPLLQKLNGTQLGYAYSLNAGVRVYFR